tara:strand:- start:10856 stop:11581 length:726 start_codon:yes stop_codon:yes gene_type:complete
MSISSYNPNDRYRQRSARRVGNMLTFIFVFGGIFGAGFWVGGLRSKQDMYILQQDKINIEEERDRVQADMTKMRAEAQTATVRLEQIRTNYDELLSDGTMKDLVSLVRQQIDQGVDAERLKSVILSARPPQNCSNSETKRFIVNTPVYQGPSSKVSLPKSVIVVTGKGTSAQNSLGKKEAWFDPGKPVELLFDVKDGQSETKKGVLPMYHSLVIEDKEYRFTMKAGEKSFVTVSYDYCDYP